MLKISPNLGTKPVETTWKYREKVVEPNTFFTQKRTGLWAKTFKSNKYYTNQTQPIRNLYTAKKSQNTTVKNRLIRIFHHTYNNNYVY